MWTTYGPSSHFERFSAGRRYVHICIILFMGYTLKMYFLFYSLYFYFIFIFYSTCILKCLP